MLSVVFLGPINACSEFFHHYFELNDCEMMLKCKESCSMIQISVELGHAGVSSAGFSDLLLCK